MAEEAKPSKEELKAQLESKKAELETARQSLTDLLKENNLKKGTDYSSHTDEKVAKSFRVRTKKVDELSAIVSDLKKQIGSTKEKKASEPRPAKYAYPENATPDEKKQFRIKQRAAAKKVGVDLDTYLKDPSKYASQLEKAKADAQAKKEENMKKQGEKLAAAAKAKAAENAETKVGQGEAPVKKVAKKEAAPAAAPAKKKKTVPAED